MTDSHAHLDVCEGPVGDLLQRARAAGVTTVIAIGTGIDSCKRALGLAAAHDLVFASLGIDPHQAASPEAGRVEELRPLLDHPKAVAVGETGLDGFHTFATLVEQRALMDAQLALAAETGLPIVVHSRDAESETRTALAGFGGTVVMHCFSSPALLDTCLERGYYVSFAGNVTYPKASGLREAAARVPADRLLAETDAPYLAPQPVRGERNEPAYVVHTLDALAAVRDEDRDELERRIDANARAAFSLP